MKIEKVDAYSIAGEIFPTENAARDRQATLAIGLLKNLAADQWNAAFRNPASLAPSLRKSLRDAAECLISSLNIPEPKE